MPRRILSYLKDKTETMAAYLPYENVYYERIADYYKLIKYGMLLILACFVLAVCIFCNQDLQPENFRYLFKYIDVDPVATSANYKDIYYNSNKNTQFAFYKGDLAVVGDGRLNLYNIAGNNILSEKLDSENAICDTEGKYLIAYEPGGKSVSVFNSFSKLYTIKYTHPVISAYAGDNGSFAVISREDSYRSAVYIYNSAFKSIYTWRSNESYAASAAVSPSGKNAAVLSYSQSGGTYLRELTIRNVSRDKSVLTASSEGAIPLKVGFFASGEMYCLYADGIEFYSSNYKLEYSRSINEDIQLFKVFSDGLILVTGKTRADSVVTCYGSDGEIKFTKNFQYSVLDAKIVDDNIYLLTDAAVYRYDEDGFAMAEAESGADKMFVFDDGNVMLCYESNTKLLKKDGFKDEN
jgi:hypothetical protein